MLTLQQLGDITSKELDRIHALDISEQAKTEMAIIFLQTKIKEVNGSIPTQDEADLIEYIDHYIYVSATLTLLYNYQEQLQDDLVADAITNLN